MNTSIGSVSATASVAAMQSTHRGERAQGKGPFEAVSGLLGMSADEISSAVSSGKSLNDLASAKGVSHDDLVAALEAGAPEELQGTSALDDMVEDIASRTGAPSGPRGHGGPPPGPPPGAKGVLSGDLTSTQQSVLDQLASLLDTSSEDLQTSLQSGASLTSAARPSSDRVRRAPSSP